MTEILDQRHVTTEQSRRAAITHLTAKIVEGVASAIYAAGRGETFEDDTQGGMLMLVREPNLRVVIRLGDEDVLLDPVRDVLRALTYDVLTKRDNQGGYLEVCI